MSHSIIQKTDRVGFSSWPSFCCGNSLFFHYYLYSGFLVRRRIIFLFLAFRSMLSSWDDFWVLFGLRLLRSLVVAYALLFLFS